MIPFPSFCGAGGSRTRVQTCCKNAFYTFSLSLIVGDIWYSTNQNVRLSSKVSLTPRSRRLLFDLLRCFVQTLIDGASGETSKTTDLVCASEFAQLSGECIRVAIYWLRELVFNGTISQPPTCLQIHTHAVKTKRPQV